MMARRVMAGRSGFSPKALFANGEQGVWYDPSDFSTMFQDSAGTTPVTAIEQPVGLMLDKSKGTLTARYNLLTYTEQFDNAVWLKYGTGAATANQTTAPDGTNTADLLQISSSNGGTYQQFDNNSSLSGQTVTASFYTKRATQSDYGHFCIYAHASGSNTRRYAVLVNLSNGTFVASQQSASVQLTNTSYSITSIGSGWYRIELTAKFPTGTFVNCGLYAEPANSTNAYQPSTLDVTNNTSGNNLYLWGAQLALATAPSAYQKITSGVGGEWTPGNHAYQSASSASRPTLSARYNLCENTEAFGNAYWTKTATSVSPNTIETLDPLGGNTADKIIPNTSSTDHFIGRSAIVSAVGKPVQNTIWIKAGGYNWAGLTDYTTGQAIINLTTGAVEAADSGISATTANAGNGWWKVTITYTASTSRGLGVDIWNSFPASTFAGNGTSGIYIWGASIVPANQSNLPYQRVNTATDYDADPKKFPPYLKFDDSNDYLVTPSIDFTATDKMTVFAGVRKLSDATNARIIAELSATTESNNGSFSLQGPNAAGAATYLWQSKGTALTDAQATDRTAPITNILTGIGDIAGDSAILRVNGVQADSDTGDQGTGNYGNYPLYIGARGGSSMYFNGHLYSLIVRGAQTPANLIAATERYVARKTGVTL